MPLTAYGIAALALLILATALLPHVCARAQQSSTRPDGRRWASGAITWTEDPRLRIPLAFTTTRPIKPGDYYLRCGIDVSGRLWVAHAFVPPDGSAPHAWAGVDLPEEVSALHPSAARRDDEILVIALTIRAVRSVPC